ncbi:hypothetical protein [Halocalculus aciditolerans]|uniref:Uncharacterized protein n=1 Tax=Halocalculus aciditolerans TaxID=1383812 RepID=A0A830F4T9_9EURY|nr:hypothetical protein [Halocalculus aciditolerans]GGL63658.1 hypothetical protein GCM10009039_21980 [Halocalculus aciditolerans]
MREDDLATRLVDHFDAAHPDAAVHLEEPYDHYGSRGVADVYVRVPPPTAVDYLVELKGDPAVRHATGANEILRQYRRMERYFYRDDAHTLEPRLSRDGPGAFVLLFFAPTEKCVRHVREHASLYASVDPDASVDGVPVTRKVAFLTGLDDAAAGGVNFLSVNAGARVGTDAFRRAVPDDTRLAAALDATE